MKTRIPNPIIIKKNKGLVCHHLITGIIVFRPWCYDLQEIKKLHEWLGRLIKYKEEQK